MNKIARGVQGAFALIFFMTIVSVLARGYAKFPPAQITAVILCGLLFTAAVIPAYIFLRKKLFGMSPERIRRIFFCVSGTVLLLQLISAFTLMTPPINDLKYVNTAALDFSVNWDRADLYSHLPQRHEGYFARYTNNQALLVILSLVYSACRKIIGSTPMAVPVLINTAGLHVSFLLTCFISRKVFKDGFTHLFCSIMAAGFSVFYTYTPYFYTDSMSMPFALGSAYLFLCGTEGRFSRRGAVKILLSGLLLAVGFRIKGSVIILLPAFLLYSAVMMNKINKKDLLKAAGVFTAASLLSLWAVGSFINSFGITDREELQKTAFPPHHWVMMGLHDRGGYYDSDYLFTKNSGDYEQKKAADTRRIKERLRDYGVSGMAEHLAKKLSYTWGDGTYFAVYFLGKNQGRNPISRFVAKSQVFRFGCSVYQCMLLIMITVSFVCGSLSVRQGRDIFFRIIICGVFFFFVIWETRSRYLVNFSPMFIMTAVYSIKSIAFAVMRRSNRTADAGRRLRNAG